MKENKKEWSGNKVTLRKAAIYERRKIFKWLTDSSITPSMMGPPLFPDAPIPTWNDFVKDYSDDFFQDSPKHTGRCFIIEVGNEEVGTVSYDLLNRKKKWTVLDIWLNGKNVCGHGFGTYALILISRHLNESEGIQYFYISPSLRNHRAIRAYEKAGFKKLKMERLQAKKKFGVDVFDYKDNLVMRMTLNKKTDDSN